MSSQRRRVALVCRLDLGGQGDGLMSESLREKRGVHSILLGGSNREVKPQRHRVPLNLPLSINLRLLPSDVSSLATAVGAFGGVAGEERDSGRKEV